MEAVYCTLVQQGMTDLRTRQTPIDGFGVICGDCLDLKPIADQNTPSLAPKTVCAS
jgi:hypothetical protein